MLVWIFAWLAACTLTFVLYINMQCVIPENIHAPPMEGHWKFLGGGGVLKAKQSMKLNWNFLGVRRCKTKNLPSGEHGYFLELHNGSY